MLRATLGPPAAWVYARIIARRNARFDAGRGIVRLDRPVISVGNLSVGGTGKTPMVALLVRWLRDAGHDPCVAMRGYGAALGGKGDEAALYAEEFPDLPIVAQPDRARGLVELFATARGERVDCVVLDDGAQHRQIARDLDVMLADATKSPFEDRVLPLGWLREPASAFARAHAVVISRADAVPDQTLAAIGRRIVFCAPRALLLHAVHAWTGFRENTERSPLPMDALRSSRCFAVCAIGNPTAFVDQARRTTMLVGHLALRDHDPYADETIRRIISNAQTLGATAILTTEKDWMKLRRVLPARWPCPVFRPVLALRVTEMEAALRALVLRACCAAESLEPPAPEPGASGAYD